MARKFFSDGPHGGPHTHPIHQDVAFPSPLPLPGALPSAHINKIDDHRNRRRTTYKTTKQANRGKLVCITLILK